MPSKTSFARFFGMTLMVSALALSVSGCAFNPKGPATGEEAAISDPLEPVNRVTFAFNEMVDAILLTPLTSIYRAVVPEVARNAVHNVVDNLKSPVYLANELMQGNLKDAGTVARRFVTNTVVGVGGIVDVAAKQGVTYQPEDFGQTMASWGVDSGPYIVWPIFGPSSLRDSIGFVADVAMDPLYWYAHNTDREEISYARSAATLLDTKDRTHELVQDLRRNSGDMYTALQSVYVQRRKALVNDLDPSKSALPTIE